MTITVGERANKGRRDGGGKEAGGEEVSNGFVECITSGSDEVIM
jgi:hypothetical protein